MILLRHPVTDAGSDICYGRLDVGLGEGAEPQITSALDALAQVTTLISSPAARCRALADRIAARDGVELRIDDRLQEYDFGAWEGMRWDSIPREQSERWMQDLWNNRAPGGERYRDMVDRVASALGDVPEDATIICHAGVIRAAMILFLDRTFDDVFAEKIPFCTPIQLMREPA